MITDPKQVTAAALDDLIRRREELLAELDTLEGATTAAHNIAIEKAALVVDRASDICSNAEIAARIRALKTE